MASSRARAAPVDEASGETKRETVYPAMSVGL
jgi:hypothetical protein